MHALEQRLERGPPHGTADGQQCEREPAEQLLRLVRRQHSGSAHAANVVEDALDALPAEARVDLLLEVEVEPLAAWLSLCDADTRSRVVGQMPVALRASVSGASTFGSRPIPFSTRSCVRH